MDRALINKIIPFSSVDGPGNRTAVFVQGCGYDCKYCHNPETRNICCDCGACVETCPTHALTMQDGKVHFDSALCCECDTCIHTCTKGCSPRVHNMSAEEVYQQVKKQVPYIRGITVSGGECTTYPEFLYALFQLCKKDGLHTLLDSNGSLDFEQYPELMSVTDGVMLDIKAWDEAEHVSLTGVSNDLVKKNMKYLASIGKLYEVRTVVVDELMNAEETVVNTAKLLAVYNETNKVRYKVIAYRPMGVREQYAHYNVPTKQYLEELALKIQAQGLHNIVII